jgi:transcriptional regulator with XRE-family HTH domain
MTRPATRSPEAKNGTAGDRLAQARRDVGLTQRALADRLGISLWSLDQLEQGRGDLSAHLPAITDATGKHAGWFGGTPPAEEAALPDRRPIQVRVRRLAARRQTGRDLVLLSVGLLVLIRFFTEIVPVLPRAANFIDIPVFVVLAIAGTLRSHGERRLGSAYVPFALPAFLFIGLCAVSVAVNPSRVEPGPVLVFLYGFLGPVGAYVATYRLWPAGRALSLSRLLVVLTVVELLVVFLADVPRFLSSSNPDLISGTFGTNAYQLVFFLLLTTGLLAGIFALEKGRLAAKLAPLFFVLILATILLAQYRALLATTGITVVLIAILLRGRARGIISAVLIAISLAFTFSYVASHFPGLRFASTLSTLHNSPGYYASQRLKSASSILTLYTDDPRFMITGTGPGTFSSRAWYTFAFANAKSRSNVQGPYVAALTGGDEYHTDVSDKYVLPKYRSGTVIQGSRALTSPFSSYVSLLAEVGLPGFLLLIGMYLWATARALRLCAQSLRRRRPAPRDPLPALLLASSVAFTVLLQMAFLDNWLEVTRITFLAWILFAVGSKEVDARAHAIG